jgi:hypothetical protein
MTLWSIVRLRIASALTTKPPLLSDLLIRRQERSRSALHFMGVSGGSVVIHSRSCGQPTPSWLTNRRGLATRKSNEIF